MENVYFMAIWYNQWTSGIINGHLGQCMAVWCSLWSFGIFFPFWYLGQEKSANPGENIWQPYSS
jgi:hypothetical protein